ncbi:MAG TPA: hypothetical protein VGL13_04390 [Polyangiaceae bacterium]
MLELLAHNGLSASYRAEDADAVALKVFDPELRVHPDATLLLEQTLSLTNALPPHLALHSIDHGFDPEVGAPFTVSAWSTKPSLTELTRRGPLSALDASTLLTQMARALRAAHARGLSHLSLKPNNVFVGEAPFFEATISDFAASKLRRMLSQEVPAVDVPWIAPEQVDDEGGPRADQFSAALVVFFAMTGRSYWKSCQSDVDVDGWRRELRAERAPVSARAAELGVPVGTELDRVFERGLAVDPAARFRSIEEFAAAFETAVGAAPPPSHIEPVLSPPLELGIGALESSEPAAFASQPPVAPSHSARRVVLVALALAAAAVVAVVAFRSSSETRVDSATTVEPAASIAEPSSDMPAASDKAESPSAVAAEVPSANPLDASPAVAASPKSNEPAFLSVRCVPACEMIFVDNKKIETSAPVAVPPGEHLVAAGRTGYPARTERITLAPGEHHTTMLSLFAQRPASPAAPAKPAKPCGKFLKRCD